MRATSYNVCTVCVLTQLKNTRNIRLCPPEVPKTFDRSFPRSHKANFKFQKLSLFVTAVSLSLSLSHRDITRDDSIRHLLIFTNSEVLRECFQFSDSHDVCEVTVRIEAYDDTSVTFCAPKLIFQTDYQAVNLSLNSSLRDTNLDNVFSILAFTIGGHTRYSD